MKLKLCLLAAVHLLGVSSELFAAGAEDITVRIDSPMKSSRWAELQRKLLDDNLSSSVLGPSGQVRHTLDSGLVLC
jgi:hypothetical protein